jgi:murein DD-endopeptidase MepM/ murein hydrolase activator NlpD
MIFSEDSLNLVNNTNHSLYQPNFVLVGRKNNFFGDIIPVYRSQGQLSTIIVSSTESLSRLVLLSRIFIVCTVSLLQELLHSIAFQAFILLSSAYQQTLSLPHKYRYLQDKILETLDLLYSQESRHLWWLDFKLEVKKINSIITDLVSQLYSVLTKFYLGSLVGVVLFIVSFSSGIYSKNPISSVLNKALNNYSIDKSFSGYTGSDTSALSVVSLLKQEAKNGNSLIFDKIIQYKVQSGDTPELVAEMYGLSPDTVIFNNEITDPAKLPETLYLPWADGYIYKAAADTKPEDLQRIYGVDQSLVYSNNEDLLDRNTGDFPKGSLILIPTTNFDAVTASNQKENDRIDNLKRAEEQKAAQNSFSPNTTASSLGFIWPTTGYVSRCIQPNHIACDIASSPVGSKPPIYAAQSGVVSDVYRFSVPGYGLAVVVDHGNGIKTLYAHMSEIENGIVPGKTLLQGQSIGIMGDTGWATGVHLHFEVIVNGVKQNPLPYIS